jgi:transcriptional regulator with XRE-family HTH domain
MTHETVAMYRQINGYTQNEVATHIGVDKATYSRYEAGKGNLKFQQLWKAANFLKVPFLLPEKRRVTYPDGLLDKLESTINRVNTSLSYSENQKQLDDLMEVFNVVLEHRYQCMNLDYDQDDMMLFLVDKIIMTIELDPRGEDLIEKAMQKQDELFESMFPQKKR